MKKALVFLATIVCLCFASVCFAATEMEARLAAFQEKAAQGDLQAMYSLAEAHFGGRFGLTKDVNKGIEWFEKAANQGFAKAQNMLGNIYRHSLGGVPEDLAKAKAWYQKACKSNWTGSCNEAQALAKRGF